MLLQALFLGLGYNATLVSLGAAALGFAAGTVGAFLFLRKRALVSDAISHATLPGLALAFLVMVAFGGEGRSLPILMLGSAFSAWVGLLCVGWLSTRTRLREDAAIGAVLSVFFGFGIVLMTVIQNTALGRQSGLEGFLLGSTAGMLRAEALMIAVGGALVVLATLMLRRPFFMIAFDESHARVQGLNVPRLDMLLMGLVLAITVVGLKIVGLILIIALLIIPPVAARFWSNDATKVVLMSGVIGGLSGYVGAAFSATAPDLPTGPIIVLAAFSTFVVSFLIAPARGLLAQAIKHRTLQHRVHLRQGLLALAQGQPVYEKLTRNMLLRDGLMRADGVATDTGREEAARILLDEQRWQALRSSGTLAELAIQDDGLTRIEDVLTPDQVKSLDAQAAPSGVS